MSEQLKEKLFDPLQEILVEPRPILSRNEAEALHKKGLGIVYDLREDVFLKVVMGMLPNVAIRLHQIGGYQVVTAAKIPDTSLFCMVDYTNPIIDGAKIPNIVAVADVSEESLSLMVKYFNALVSKTREIQQSK